MQVKKTDVQYIRYYYSDGSGARVAEKAILPKKKKAVLPKPKQQPVLHIGPLTIVGLMMCVVMVVLMAVGMNRLEQIQQEASRLESYVDQLTMENGRLHRDYEAGYDLTEVEYLAEGLGMIPMDQASHVRIFLPAETQEQTPVEHGFFHSLTDLLG